MNNINLTWRGYFRTLGPFYYASTNKEEPYLKQFIREAGFDGTKVSVEQYDAVLEAASKHRFSITTIGGPDEDPYIEQLNDMKPGEIRTINGTGIMRFADSPSYYSTTEQPGTQPLRLNKILPYVTEHADTL
jgi:hypothetical protein